jgi:DNA-binding response OmpR family regulator
MTSPCYHFDEFELDCNRFELRHNGRTLKLERIPMELLILLLERQGRSSPARKSSTVSGVRMSSSTPNTAWS